MQRKRHVHANKLRGYVKAPKQLIYDPNLSSDEKLVWLTIAEHQGDNEEAWPSQAAIAAALGIHRNTVGRAIQKLSGMGCVDTIVRPGRVNVYRVNRNWQPAPTCTLEVQVPAPQKCNHLHSKSATTCTLEVHGRRTSEEEPLKKSVVVVGNAMEEGSRSDSHAIANQWVPPRESTCEGSCEYVEATNGSRYPYVCRRCGAESEVMW